MARCSLESLHRPRSAASTMSSGATPRWSPEAADGVGDDGLFEAQHLGRRVPVVNEPDGVLAGEELARPVLDRLDAGRRPGRGRRRRVRRRGRGTSTARP